MLVTALSYHYLEIETWHLLQLHINMNCKLVVHIKYCGQSLFSLLLIAHKLASCTYIEELDIYK